MVNIYGQMGRTTGENWWVCTAYLTPSSVFPVATGQKLMLETESIGARKITGHLTTSSVLPVASSEMPKIVLLMLKIICMYIIAVWMPPLPLKYIQIPVAALM